MATALLPSLVILLCMSSVFAQSPNPFQCSLGDVLNIEQQGFPDIEELAVESYQMTVEYTLPNLKQTDVYTEYYDIAERMGKVNAHQAGKYSSYMYDAETSEAWNVDNDKCEFDNITGIPDILRDFQSDWIFFDESDPTLRTIGPSAMFKKALAEWKGQSQDNLKMVFLGEEEHNHIRGNKARAWRWCQAENASVTFFFTANDTDNAYKIKTTPLRVTYRGFFEKPDDITEQSYDIINFQPYISDEEDPFEIPKGMGCKRGSWIESPKLPIVEPGSPVLFWGEVIYKLQDRVKGDDLGTYYSKIMLAVDPLFTNIAYRSSPWNSTLKKGKDGEKDQIIYFQDDPVYQIYDVNLDYAYMIKQSTGECQIKRGSMFTPSFRLPENNGDLDLTNPYVFFPNSEFTYLKTDIERELKVDIFEAVGNGYVFNMTSQAERVISSHSYYTADVKLDSEASVKNAPVSTEMHILRKLDSKVEEILTINFFGFSTKLSNRRQYLFDISRCFKNDDEYSWVTIVYAIPGDRSNFDVDQMHVEERFLSSLISADNLNFNPTRVPKVMVDIGEDVVITFLLLEKPPLKLDFTKKVEGVTLANPATTLGLNTFETCGASCLDDDKCWGFSLCGNECLLGQKSNTTTKVDKNCELYERYDMDKKMMPKSQFIGLLQSAVNVPVNDPNKWKLTVVNKKTDEEVDLQAIFIQETDLAVGDKNFDQKGNRLSSRLRVLKVGQKLKKGQSLGVVGYDECQKLCLDYTDCETMSYCLNDRKCVVSPKYGEEIKDEEKEDSRYCQLVTRTYTDQFEAIPGYKMKVDSRKSVKTENAEACARACIKETGFKCLSVDMCADDESGNNCFFFDTHFLKKSTKKDDLGTKASCIHYSRKYSFEFKKQIQQQIKDPKSPIITNLELEECAKQCVDLDGGSCYGFDFCQGKTIANSRCVLIDSDPSRLETTHSSVCTEYLRDGTDYEKHPFTNSYATGIAILCFIIGGLVGAAVVFVIGYIKVNKR